MWKAVIFYKSASMTIQGHTDQGWECFEMRAHFGFLESGDLSAEDRYQGWIEKRNALAQAKLLCNLGLFST